MIRDELARDLGMALLFSGLVDDFRGNQIATFCDQVAQLLLEKYSIAPSGSAPTGTPKPESQDG